MLYYPTVHEELFEELAQIHQQETTLISIYDDFHSSPETTTGEDAIDRFAYFNQQEVYHILDHKNASEDNIHDCVWASDTLWHSLCVLNTAKLNLDQKQLSTIDIQEICKHAQLIFIYAYDGDGYLFWQREGCTYF